MTHFALTEHMPRTDIGDLYPEEVRLTTLSPSKFLTRIQVERGVSITEFIPLYNAYLQEAVRLRAKY